MTLMPDFTLIRPTTLAEAVAARQAHPEGRLLAGGTDLLVNLRRGIGTPPALIDLGPVRELQGISFEKDGGLRLGAMTPLAKIAADPHLKQAYPALVEAALAVAGPTHRRVATVGGNLCLDTRCIRYNQSEWWRAANDYCMKYQGTVCKVVPTSSRCHAVFSGDLAPALLVLGAAVELHGPDGARRMPLSAFYRDDGQSWLHLDAGELLTSVFIPHPVTGLCCGYVKTRVRNAIDFPLVGVAVALRRDGAGLAELRIAYTGTSSTPVQVAGVEELLGRPLSDDTLERLAVLARKAVQPLRTTVMTPKYRRSVAINTLLRLVQRLYAAAEPV